MEASLLASPSKALLLNASYEPLRIVSWQRALLLLMGGKIDVLDTYETLVRSPSVSLKVPAVIMMKRYVVPRAHKKLVRFSREHVFFRDDFTCQYCLEEFSFKELTLDHIIPVKRGGRKTWTNIVTCCVPCNQKKGSRTPEEAGFRHFRGPSEPAPGFLPDLLYFKEDVPSAWKPYLESFTEGVQGQLGARRFAS